MQRWKGPDGVDHQVGDAEDIGQLLGISPETWATYVRKPSANNPAPRPVTIDPVSRRDLWRVDQVLEWQARRPGPGDHRGEGARRRWSRE